VLQGDAYLAGGDTAKALATYQQAAARDPRNVEATLKVGTLSAQKGFSETAIQSFRAVLKLDPNNGPAMNNLAWMLADSGGDLAEALRLAESAVKSAPQSADAQDTLGWVRYRRSELPQAVAALEVAKKLAPARADIAGHLGLAYAKAGRRPQAVSELKRALEHPEQVSPLPEVKQTLAQLTAAK
jgi:tetratricopeptide (TPR) repeat protein